MKYYLLEPEVAGEIGEGSRINYENGKIKEVIFLEYCFSGWQGDELLASHPCFIITKALEKDIQQAKLLGAEFSEIKMSFSEEYYDFDKTTDIPEFVRIECKNSYEENIKELKEDFYYNKYKDLIVSEKALSLIKKYCINNCDVKEIEE